MIGIIGAMASEVDGLKSVMTNLKIDRVSSVDFCCGEINGANVVVAQAGVGKVNAAITAQTMILKYNVCGLINIGVAGGLAKDLKIGDIVVATKVVEHDMDTTALGDEPGFITGLDCVYIDTDERLTQTIYQCAEDKGFCCTKGIIASGDVFVSNDTQRNKLINVFNAAAAEMEGAAIGHVCAVNNVPFAVLRAMSDCANDDSKVDFPTFAEMSAKNSIEIIKLFLERNGKEK